MTQPQTSDIRCGSVLATSKTPSDVSINKMKDQIVPPTKTLSSTVTNDSTAPARPPSPDLLTSRPRKMSKETPSALVNKMNQIFKSENQSSAPVRPPSPKLVTSSQPIRDQCVGHVVTLDQTEAQIVKPSKPIKVTNSRSPILKPMRPQRLTSSSSEADSPPPRPASPVFHIPEVKKTSSTLTKIASTKSIPGFEFRDRGETRNSDPVRSTNERPVSWSRDHSQPIRGQNCFVDVPPGLDQGK